jgi:hypothetical protein
MTDRSPNVRFRSSADQIAERKGERGPVDEIATAIARCAGRLTDCVANVERTDRGEAKRSIATVATAKIFFDRSA